MYYIISRGYLVKPLQRVKLIEEQNDVDRFEDELERKIIFN